MECTIVNNRLNTILGLGAAAILFASCSAAPINDTKVQVSTITSASANEDIPSNSVELDKRALTPNEALFSNIDNTQDEKTDAIIQNILERTNWEVVDNEEGAVDVNHQNSNDAPLDVSFLNASDKDHISIFMRDNVNSDEILMFIEGTRHYKQETTGQYSYLAVYDIQDQYSFGIVNLERNAFATVTAFSSEAAEIGSISDETKIAIEDIIIPAIFEQK